MQQTGAPLGGEELEEAMEPDPPPSNPQPIEIIEKPPEEEGVDLLRLRNILETGLRQAKQQPTPPSQPKPQPAQPTPPTPHAHPSAEDVLEDFQRKWVGPEVWFDNSSKWKHPETPLHYEDCWEVIRAMFKERGFVHHQTGSWNAFLHRLPTILESHGYVSLKHRHEGQDGFLYELSYGRTYLTHPCVREQDVPKQVRVQQMPSTQKFTTKLMLPDDCRKHNHTYASMLYADVHFKVQRLDENMLPTGVYTKDLTITQFPIGEIPVMLRSMICALTLRPSLEPQVARECANDPGGYFIVKGLEKVIISQEDMARNRFMICNKSTSDGRVCYEAEIRSQAPPELINFSPSLFKMHMKKSKGFSVETIQAEIKHLKCMVPVTVLFRALGISDEKDMLDLVTFGAQEEEIRDLFQYCVEEGNACTVVPEVAAVVVTPGPVTAPVAPAPEPTEPYPVRTQKDAIRFIASRQKLDRKLSEKLTWITNVLLYQLFPHMGKGESSLRKKAFFLGFLCNRMLSVRLGREKPDQRDDMANKAIRTAGDLMCFLMVDLIRKLAKAVKKGIYDWVTGGTPLQDPTVILRKKQGQVTQRLRHSLSTGNWLVGNPSYRAGMHGITAQLLRINYIAQLSHLQRLNASIPKEGKLTEPRKLPGSHVGVSCIAETPDRDSVGLTKNFGLLYHVSVGYHGHLLEPYLAEFSLVPLEVSEALSRTCRANVSRAV